MKWEHKLYSKEHKTKSSQHSGDYSGSAMSQSEQNTLREKGSRL